MEWDHLQLTPPELWEVAASETDLPWLSGVGQDGQVSEFLVLYLDSIDERRLDYLDEDDELRPEVVKRLRYYTTALLDGTITLAAVAEDWPDWFDLVGAFVAAYAPEAVAELGEGPEFNDAEDFDQPLSKADRSYLVALEPLLDA